MQGEGAARGPPPAFFLPLFFLPNKIKGGIGSSLPSVTPFPFFSVTRTSTLPK